MEFIYKVVIIPRAVKEIRRCIALRFVSEGAKIITDGLMTGKMIYEP